MSVATASKFEEENELTDVKYLSKEEEEKGDGSDVVRITYDEALEKYGNGRYQIILFILMSLITWTTVCNNIGYIFIGAYQEHTCKPPENAFNWTGSIDSNESATVTYELGKCTYDTIAVYEDNRTVVLEKDVECNSWDYDQSSFQLTMISEWDLNSCKGTWYTAVANSMFMVGFLIGCVVLADLSDRYGRNLLLVISNVAMVISGVAAAFSVNYYMLIIMRCLLGIFTAGARNAAFVYFCEVVTFRESAGMIVAGVYCTGGVIVTAIAYALNNWRHFQLACALSFCVFIPYYWLLPESPRWSLTKGNTQSAIDFFRKSARINGVSIPDKFDVYIEHETEKGNVLTLFKGINIRKKTIVVCILWFSVSIVYFGMIFNVGNLTGDIFINNYLLQGVGGFGFLGIWYVRLGRRIAVSSAFLLACLFCGILLFFAEFNIYAGVITMGMLGVLLVQTNFFMLYIVTTDIYPTTERVTALGLGSSVARVGGAIAPYIVLTNDVWPNLPYVMFGAIALIAGLFAITLPETKGKALPDSLHQVETEIPMNSLNCCKRNSSEGEVIHEQA